MNLRFLSIIGVFWSKSILAEIEYRVNLIVEIFSVIGNLSGSILILSLFYSNGNNLGGWTWNASLTVLGVYTLLEGFTTCILQPNLSRIVSHIQQGTLDFILLKPFNSQLWVSFRIFSPWGLPSVVSGIILISIGIHSSNEVLSFNSFLICFLMLISSILILYSLWFVIASTSIWFVRVWNANEVLRSTLVAGRYPLSAYPDSLRRFFTFIIPIGFLTTVPAQAAMNSVSIGVILASCAFALLLLWISNRFWLFALRFYTSASS